MRKRKNQRTNKQGRMVAGVCMLTLGILCGNGVAPQTTVKAMGQVVTTQQSADATTQQSADVTSQQPDATTQQPDATSQQPVATTQQSDVTSQQPVATTQQSATDTASNKAQKKKTYKFVTKKGKTYCVNEKGKKVKKQFVKIKKRTYYVDKKGVRVQGWTKIKNNYYYFDRAKGVMSSGCKVDGIKLKKNGKAVKSKENVYKIQTMMRAANIVNSISKPTDSKSVKRKKCFDWVMKFPYKRYRLLATIYKQKGWEMDFANDMFIRKGGCCVSEASAFAFLARECGYKKVEVCHDTSHAWVEIEGMAFDPLFAEAKSYSKYYNVKVSKYPLHAVGRRKI